MCFVFRPNVRCLNGISIWSRWVCRKNQIISHNASHRNRFIIGIIGQWKKNERYLGPIKQFNENHTVKRKVNHLFGHTRKYGVIKCKRKSQISCSVQLKFAFVQFIKRLLGKWSIWFSPQFWIIKSILFFFFSLKSNTHMLQPICRNALCIQIRTFSARRPICIHFFPCVINHFNFLRHVILRCFLLIAIGIFLSV